MCESTFSSDSARTTDGVVVSHVRTIVYSVSISVSVMRSVDIFHALACASWFFKGILKCIMSAKLWSRQGVWVLSAGLNV